jgi:hypothetical protein
MKTSQYQCELLELVIALVYSRAFYFWRDPVLSFAPSWNYKTCADACQKH